MKHLGVILFAIFFSNMSTAQEQPRFVTLSDPKQEGSNMLVGAINWNDITSDATCRWYSKGFARYTPDSVVLAQLKKKIGDYTFIVCLGTWCSDTQELLPQFSKVLHACHVPDSMVELIGMDRQKHGVYVEHQILRIEYLPTIIISKGPREIGRIVESLEKKNIETELLYLIEKDSN